MDGIIRFLKYVDTSDPSGCWNWLGARYGTKRNYGQFRFRGRGHAAHRVSYILGRGEIPDGTVLDHLCRNTLCVNPKHLEPVTQRINIIRGVSPAAQNVLKTHCKRGHEFTPENTTLMGGGRGCRACNKTRAALWRAKHPTYMTAYNKANWRKYAKGNSDTARVYH